MPSNYQIQFSPYRHGRFVTRQSSPHSEDDVPTNGPPYRAPYQNAPTRRPAGVVTRPSFIESSHFLSMHHVVDFWFVFFSLLSPAQRMHVPTLQLRSIRAKSGAYANALRDELAEQDDVMTRDLLIKTNHVRQQAHELIHAMTHGLRIPPNIIPYNPV